jgi:hypothetical protein
MKNLMAAMETWTRKHVQTPVPAGSTYPDLAGGESGQATFTPADR